MKHHANTKHNTNEDSIPQMSQFENKRLASVFFVSPAPVPRRAVKSMPRPALSLSLFSFFIHHILLTFLYHGQILALVCRRSYFEPPGPRRKSLTPSSTSNMVSVIHKKTPIKHFPWRIRMQKKEKEKKIRTDPSPRKSLLCFHSVVNCIGTSTAVTSCATSDFQCLCVSSAFIDAVASCLNRDCSADEYDVGVALGTQVSSSLG